MTCQEFEKRIDALIEEYTLDNPDYEDIHISYIQSWKGEPNEWMIDVDITKREK